MKRVFSSYKLIWSDAELNDLFEGIQTNGGDILSISLVRARAQGIEHLVIMYEDNDKYLEIKKFLHGKEDKYQ